MTALRLPLTALAVVLLARSAPAQDASTSNAAPPNAQLAATPRVLFAVSDSLKGDDGVYRRLQTVVTYDPAAGAYVHETRDASGQTLSRTVRAASVAGPTAAEAQVARQRIAAHPEIARLAGAARGTVTIDGGFPLVREAGHPCGPGGRCASYDVFETTASGRRRLRYVVVDLRAGRVLDADADAQRDSNLAHPDARRQSRIR